jgi:hypothetical protein
MALTAAFRTRRGPAASEIVVEQYPTAGGHKVQLIEFGTAAGATTYGYECTGCRHSARPQHAAGDRVQIGGHAEAHAMTCRKRD